jgi:hypothetical protein
MPVIEKARAVLRLVHSRVGVPCDLVPAHIIDHAPSTVNVRNPILRATIAVFTGMYGAPHLTTISLPSC